MKKNTTAAAATRRDICEEITAKIVEALESGVAPWIKPWQGDAGVPGLGGLPYNAATGRPYHGGNVLLLWCAGFADPRWVTFQQALDLGGHVRKGEKGQKVCWWSPVARKSEEEGEDAEARKYMACRVYTVFNVSQCEGLTLKDIPQALQVDPANAQGAAETIATRVGAKVILGGVRACYMKTTDDIRVPVRDAFEDDGAYDAALFHELVHWTGTKERCNRVFGTRFGDLAYAFEELVAEIGSAFLCALTGVKGHLQHTEYLGMWAKVLKADKYAIFTAAREAEKACRMLLPEETPVEAEENTQDIAA